MAGQNCNGCRSWEEDIYWTHFQFLHFAQFLPAGYDQQLALPKTFSDNLKKKLPENVTLKGPGGVVWNIGLTTKDETLYFARGWEQFVKDHSLKENDFLVFKYNGESLFDVLVFDGVSFCEKAGSYFVRKCGHAAAEHAGGACSSKRRDTDNSGEEVNTPSNGGVECISPQKSVHINSIGVPFAVPIETPNEKPSNGVVESTCPEKVMAEADSVPDPSAVPFQAVPFQAVPFQAVPSETTPSQTYSKRIRKPVYAATPTPPTKKRGRPPKASIEWVTVESEPASADKTGMESEPASAAKTGSNELYTSNRRPVTVNEIQNALHLAKVACTEYSFHVAMQPTHVYKRFYVSINNKWILNHISPKSQDVILRTGNREWTARYSYDSIRHSGGLTNGWKHFAVDNNLEEYDVCVLTPAGQVNGTMIIDVSIFRVVDEITPLTAVKSPGKRGRKPVASFI